MTTWNLFEEDRLRRLWVEHRGSFGKIAREMGRTRGSVDGKSRVLGLHFPPKNRTRTIDPLSPPIRDARTFYPSRVVAPTVGLLKGGDNQRKLGRIVTKGRWKGFPIYSLTLEERATCPRTCDQFLSCYGNGMGHAKRYRHGPRLLKALRFDLVHLQNMHADGFVIRLHILGDFYSVEYVDYWREALHKYPALHVFGYTHWQSGTPIGDAIAALRDRRWMRFAVRTSSAAHGPRTSVIASEADAAGAIICPAQTGRTTSCGTCSLCWASKKPVAFLSH